MEDRYMTYRVPKEQGPRIAVIGGGHGLSNMLRGLKQYSEAIIHYNKAKEQGSYAAECSLKNI